ncbi:hypothetical protein [Clostridium sp.]|uniref:hypothetical protein n=1 Tax=Clostridium sp. TaxID=1506 RepID=UPI002FCBDE9A
MSPLAKEIIEKLNKEEDTRVLAEVLDFYEYLKLKRNKELQKKWENICEAEPTEEEISLYKNYKELEEELVPLNSLIKELNLHEE